MGQKNDKFRDASRNNANQTTRPMKQQNDLPHRIDIEPQAVHNTNSNARVFQCFCGCSELTMAQIEEIAMMNVLTLVTNPLSKTVFHSFLRIGHRTDKSEAMRFFECFLLCEKLLANLELVESNLEALLELCTYAWEMKINEAIKTDKQKHSNDNLRRVLVDLKADCVRGIECHRDFGRFREELLRKIGRK